MEFTMTNEIEQLKKLLTAFIEAQGFEVEQVADYQERQEAGQVRNDMSSRRLKFNLRNFNSSVLITPIIDYKVHRKIEVTNLHSFMNDITTEDFITKTRQDIIKENNAKDAENERKTEDKPNPNKEEKDAEVVVNDDTKLVPCPFCGCDDVSLRESRINGEHEVFCLYCRATGAPMNDEKKALERWNHRGHMIK